MEIGKKLKKKRQEAKLTQKELAEILHVSRQTISSWEVGRTYPDLDVLVAISELYDTPLDDLLKEDSQMVKDITEKVKKSERRKIMNIVLSAVLIIFAGVVSINTWDRYQNNKVNAYGLSPNDLYNSSWEMFFTPNKDLMTSILSFESESVMLQDRYTSMFLNPSINLEEFAETTSDMGLDYNTEYFDNLTIETVEDTYLVSAQGYRETFEQLSNSVIRDSKGTEYYKLSSSSLHEALQYYEKIWEDAREQRAE